MAGFDLEAARKAAELAGRPSALIDPLKRLSHLRRLVRILVGACDEVERLRSENESLMADLQNEMRV